MSQTTPPAATLDVRGFLCPIPARKAQEAVALLASGDILRIIGDDPVMVIDIPAWCADNGHQLIDCQRAGATVTCTVRKG